MHGIRSDGTRAKLKEMQKGGGLSLESAIEVQQNDDKVDRKYLSNLPNLSDLRRGGGQGARQEGGAREPGQDRLGIIFKKVKFRDFDRPIHIQTLNKKYSCLKAFFCPTYCNIIKAGIDGYFVLSEAYLEKMNSMDKKICQ